MTLGHARLLHLAASALLLAGACQGAAQNPPAATPRVLASTTVLADLAQHVAGDRLSVEALVPAGADPHEYQLSPRDGVKIASAQVLIVNGVGYEEWLQKTLQNVGGQQLLITATTGLSPRLGTTGATSEGDPHMWLDVTRAVRYVENIRDGLSQADPAGKETYSKDADSYVAQLQDLDRWIRSQVGKIPAQRRLLVTNHDSLGYFAEAYGFSVVGAVIPSFSDQASPSAREMTDLIRTIRSVGAPAVFVEAGVNSKLAEEIASEAGVRVVTDLYLETLSAPSGPAPSYVDMMKYDVTRLVNALK